VLVATHIFRQNVPFHAYTSSKRTFSRIYVVKTYLFTHIRRQNVPFHAYMSSKRTFSRIYVVKTYLFTHIRRQNVHFHAYMSSKRTLSRIYVVKTYLLTKAQYMHLLHICTCFMYALVSCMHVKARKRLRTFISFSYKKKRLLFRSQKRKAQENTNKVIQ
jgi:hypothetical protein